MDKTNSMVELTEQEIEAVAGGIEMCRPGDGTVDSGDWIDRFIRYTFF